MRPNPIDTENGDRSVGSSAKHIGILVIHGMGDEDAYGTLDSFARGLYRHFGGPGNPAYRMQTEWKERGSDPSHLQQEWTQAQIRFEPVVPCAGGSEPPRLTVAEYYWSPATKGKMKDLDVLLWLIQAGLSPIRYLSANLQAMLDADQEEDGEAASSSRAKTYARRTWRGGLMIGREILRFALIYIPLLGSFVALAMFLGALPGLPASLKGLATLGLPGRGMALAIAVRLMMLGGLASYFWNFGQWIRFRTPNTRPLRRFTWNTLAAAAAFAILLAVFPVWLPAAWYQACDPGVGHAMGWASLFASPARFLLVTPPFTALFWPLAELAVAAVVRLFLTGFLGDVAIYTNLNERNANFAVRAQILGECGHALTSLYSDLMDEAIARTGKSPEEVNSSDFQIVIAAHSLGTVIAYDTVNDLFNRARIAAPASGAVPPPAGGSPFPGALPVCRHLRGLLTFGSPLNKTYYFFRDQSGAEELVRAQLVDQLHAFRLRAPQGGLDGVVVAPEARSPALEELERNFGWYNLWSVMDIVSGKLLFYRLPRAQKHVWYPVPVLAHLSYWKDERMYAWFAQCLLRECPAPPASAAAELHPEKLTPVAS